MFSSSLAILLCAVCFSFRDVLSFINYVSNSSISLCSYSMGKWKSNGECFNYEVHV